MGTTVSQIVACLSKFAKRKNRIIYNMASIKQVRIFDMAEWYNYMSFFYLTASIKKINYMVPALPYGIIVHTV